MGNVPNGLAPHARKWHNVRARGNAPRVFFEQIAGPAAATAARQIENSRRRNRAARIYGNRALRASKATGPHREYRCVIKMYIFPRKNDETTASARSYSNAAMGCLCVRISRWRMRISTGARARGPHCNGCIVLNVELGITRVTKVQRPRAGVLRFYSIASLNDIIFAARAFPCIYMLSRGREWSAHIVRCEAGASLCAGEAYLATRFPIWNGRFCAAFVRRANWYGTPPRDEEFAYLRASRGLYIQLLRGAAAAARAFYL